MDAWEKWILFQFTPHQKSPSQNGCYSKKLSSNDPCCKMASAAFKYTSPKQQTTFAFSSNISCQKVVPVYGVGIPEFAEPLCGVLVPAVNYPAVHLEIYKYSLLLLDRSPRVRALNKYTAQSHALKYTAPVQIFFAGNALHTV